MEHNWWSKEKSLDYLRKEAFIDVNLIKAYYIEMALNADSVKFIKDLYHGPLPLGGKSVLLLVLTVFKEMGS